MSGGSTTRSTLAKVSRVMTTAAVIVVPTIELVMLASRS